MSKLRSFKRDLAPSIGGMIWYLVIALATVVFNAHYLKSLITNKTSQQAIPHLTTKLSSILSWTNNEMLSHLGVSTSNNLVVGLTWGFIGLIVYILCMIILGFFRRLIEIIQLKRYVIPSDSSRIRLLLEPLGKLLLQLLMTVVLFVYIVRLMAPVMLGYLLPLTGHKANIKADLIRVVVYVLILHGFVVILRLIFLRERLGGQNELPESHNL